MADEKKPAPKTDLGTMIAEIIGIVILAYFVGSMIPRVTGSGSTGGIFSLETWRGFMVRLGVDSAFDSLLSVFIFFSIIISMLFIIGIVYSIVKVVGLEKQWHAAVHPQPAVADTDKPKNERWARVVVHIGSENPSDWRLAILECDIILDELLDKHGYVGGTIGDKLKAADSSRFKTLDNAWEAHKIRNAIAHEGQDFTLTQREARRIVGLYETVFREFDFI